MTETGKPPKLKPLGFCGFKSHLQHHLTEVPAVVAQRKFDGGHDRGISALVEQNGDLQHPPASVFNKVQKSNSLKTKQQRCRIANPVLVGAAPTQASNLTGRGKAW